MTALHQPDGGRRAADGHWDLRHLTRPMDLGRDLAVAAPTAAAALQSSVSTVYVLDAAGEWALLAPDDFIVHVHGLGDEEIRLFQCEQIDDDGAWARCPSCGARMALDELARLIGQQADLLDPRRGLGRSGPIDAE